MPERTLGVLVAGLVAVAATASVDARTADVHAAETGRAQWLAVSSEDGGALQVAGDRRYLDIVEIRPDTDGDGLVLVNDVDLETYVAGIAEMPARWPSEALKAQAVAARTYAWYAAERGVYEHYDICATTACQVYRGVDASDDPAGRWRDAVEATAGEVLVDQGAPILARYFSTSGGRTYANEAVFPESGPHPRLVAIDDAYDAVSPYHRWTTTFTRAEFDEILSRGETLHTVVPVASVDRRGPARDPQASIEVVGEDGATVTVGAVELRDFLSRVAPERFPDRFPGLREDGLLRLPSTVPSSRFEVEVTPDEVVLHGQGWGHGVGMGQYGARGRAQDGHDYREILASYYGGLEPTRASGLPERIRVGIEAGPETTITAGDAFSIRSPDGVIQQATLGTWTVRRAGDGVELLPPDEHDTPLRLSPLERSTAALDASGVLTVETEVSKAALLRLEVLSPDGGLVLRHELGAVEPGAQAVTWRYVDERAEPVAPGRYALSLVAEDASGAVERTSMDVEVPVDGGPDAPDARQRSDDRPTPVVLLGGATAVVLLAWLAWTRRSRA